MADLSQMSDADLYAAAGISQPDSADQAAAPLSHLSDADLYKIAGIAPSSQGGQSTGNFLGDATLGALSGVSNSGTAAIQRVNELTSTDDKGKKSSLVSDFYKAVLPFIRPDLADQFQDISPDDIQQATASASKHIDQLKPDTAAGSVGNFAGQVAPLVALGPSEAGLLTQGLAGGAIAGALTPTTNQTADASGNQALINTGVGAGTGAIAAPLLAPVAGLVGKAAGAIGNKISDMLPGATDAAVNIDNIPGVSDDIKQSLSGASDDVLKSFKGAVDGGLTPKQALIKAQADDLGVPLTAGDITQDPVQQGREDLARTGAYGPDAKAIAQQAIEAKQGALSELATNTASNVSSGGAIGANEADIGNNIADKVTQLAGQAKSTASEAYDNLKGVTAEVPLEQVKQLPNAIITTLADQGYDLGAMPNVQRRISDINKFIEKATSKTPAAEATGPIELSNASTSDNPHPYDALFNPGGVKSISLPGTAKAAPLPEPANDTMSLQTLEQFRKRIINSPTSSPAEGSALGAMRGVYDNFANNLIDKNLIIGSPDALDQIKAARGLWANYKQTFFGKDGKSIIGKIVKGNYTGEATMNMLIGANKAGANAGNAINNLKGVLGADSQEFNQLKLAQFTRLWGNDLQGVLQGELKRGSQGSVFAKNVDDLFTNNKTLADALYTPAEQQQLKAAARVTAYATTTQPRAVSSSGTTNVLLNFVNPILDKIPGIGKYLAGGFTKATKGVVNSTESLALKKEFAGEVSDKIKALNQSPSFSRTLGAKAAGVAGADADQAAMQIVGSSSTAQSNPSPSPTTTAQSAPINPLFKQAFNQMNSPDFSSDPISYAASKTGSDPAFLASVAQKESGMNPAAKNPNSSATGLFQLTKPTWNALVDKYGQQYGITKDMIDDPKANAVMGALYAKDNKTSLDKTLGRESTNGEVYMAHFLGASGAKKLISNYSDSIPAARLFPAAAKENRSMFFDGRKPVSTQQLYQRLSRNIS